MDITERRKQYDSSGWRAPAVEDTEWWEKNSLRCSPLGRRRCTVAVPREERARAVVETGPRGKHGATQEPHSAPAQDA